MASVEFVPFDLEVHMDEYIQMNIEYLTWVSEQYMEHFNIDAFSILGQSVKEYVEDHLEPFISLKPTEGILYILEYQGKITGMGAIYELRDKVGEIKRMWTRPEFRAEDMRHNLSIIF